MINAKGSLKGVVTAKQRLEGTIAGASKLTGKVNVGGTIKIEPVHYEGEYEVTPSTEQKVLETKQKFMDDDVTVRKIPFYEVSNATGGTTITIGKDV